MNELLWVRLSRSERFRMGWRGSTLLSNSDLSADGVSRVPWSSLSSSLLRPRDLAAWDGFVFSPLLSAHLFCQLDATLLRWGKED